MKIVRHPAANEPGGWSFLITMTHAEVAELRASEERFSEVFKRMTTDLSVSVASAVYDASRAK